MIAPPSFVATSNLRSASALAATALAYVDALEKELAEVEASYAALVANDVSKLSASLEAHGMKRIDLAAWRVDEDGPRGGHIEALAEGMVGLRFTGNAAALETETGEKD